MDYKKLIHRLIAMERLEKNYNSDYNGIYSDAANAITDLLVRAEEVEARCETLEKMIREYQDVIVPGYRERAKKAEREKDKAVGDLETIMVIGDSGLDTCDFCKNNQCYARSGNNPCLPKWRGIQEE